MADDRLSLAIERERRRKRAEFTAERLLFPQQRAFAIDAAKLVAACTTRRAGKTQAAAFKLLFTALSKDNVNCVYLAVTIKQARRNIWSRLCDLNSTYALGGKVNNSRYTIAFPNGSVVHLSGMDEIAEAEKWKGTPRLLLIVIDEAASYRSDVLEYGVREVFRPGLLDLKGSQIVLMGTPGPLPAGYFYDIITGETSSWSRHHWGIWDNSFLEGDWTDEVRDACEEKGCDESDPWIQRNYYGLWVPDVDSLIFPYDPERNDWDPRKEPLPPGGLYVAGVDFGVRDADAIAVWYAFGRTTWLVHEDVNRDQTTDKIVTQIKSVSDTYPLVDLVGDPAGGTRISLDLAALHAINLRPAEKPDRIAAINLMADAIRSGRVKVQPTSRMVQEWKRLEWQPGFRGLKERTSGFHSDLAGAAGLYGWRAASRYFTLEEALTRPSRPLTIAEQWELRLKLDEEREADQAANDNDWAEADWRKQGY